MLWYLTRNYEKWIVYDGTNLNDVLDWQEALKFKKENPTFWEYTIYNLYWKEYKFKFPDYWLSRNNLDWWEDITLKWYDKVLELSLLWYINDYTLGAHKALTDSFDIFVKKTWWEELYQLVQKERLAEIVNNLNEDEALIEVQNEIRHTTDWHDWEMIMMKEYIMDYRQPEPLRYRPHRSSQPKEFKISNNYTLDIWNRWSVNVYDNYTAALRYQMLHKALEEWNMNPKYRLNQRQNLLQWWQADAMKRMGRRTVILCPRRWWKTVVMALEILKEMLSYNYKSGTRPRSVMFLSKDFDAVTQVMDYIKSLIDDLDWLKMMFNYSESNHIFSLDTFDEQWKKKTVAQCKFYSALGKLPWVGDAADAVFIDEAMLIPTRVKDKIMAIVNHEWARFLAVSTFYSEDEDGVDKLYYRPVKMCNEFEKESSKIVDIDDHIYKLFCERERTGAIPDECAWLRYTIDDVEVIVNKDLAKEALADKPENYMRELYCRVSEQQNVFNYKPYVIPVKYTDNPHPMYFTPDWTTIKPKFERIVTAYDPAQTGDISAFLATWYDKERNKIIILKEWQLNFKDKSSFIPQAQLIKEALKELERFNCPILKTIDSTHQAVVDVMWGQRIFFQYLYFWTGWENIKKWVRPSEWRLPKKLMIEAAQTMFDNGMIEIWDNDCKTLIDQLGSFVEFKNDYTNRSKYQWDKGTHDDFVACLLMCIWTYWNHLWLSHNKFQIDTFTEYAMKQDESSDPLGLLDWPDKPIMHYECINNEFWY